MSNDLSAAMYGALISGENLLILAPRPGDESMACGGLVARCCRHGRPPFVMILTDGSTTSASTGPNTPDELARMHERETRRAVQCLGLPAQRMLMAGLFDGTVPLGGPAFEAVVRGITLVMWARDCNVICAPASNQGGPDQIAASRIAGEVARRSGVRLLRYTQPGSRSPDCCDGLDPGHLWRIDISRELPAKRAAIKAHATQFDTVSFLDLHPYEELDASPVLS